MKKAILFCILTAVLSVLKAQTFTYSFSYDASGNRTKRTCIQVKGNMGESIFDSSTGTLKDSYVISETLEDNFGENLITVYPNPTAGELVIKIDPLPDKAQNSISVIGLDGRIHMMITELAIFNHLDLTGFSNGNYLLRLDLNGIIKTYEVVKQ